MMTRSDVDNLFAEMKENAPFDVEGDLLWGYFFTDADKAKLRPLAEELAALGYREVALYRTDDRRMYFLHVERVERHTPESLDALNRRFEALAERHGIVSYDGMDVGPVE
jgi:exonuclease I